MRVSEPDCRLLIGDDVSARHSAQLRSRIAKSQRAREKTRVAVKPFWTQLANPETMPSTGFYIKGLCAASSTSNSTNKTSAVNDSVRLFRHLVLLDLAPS